MPELKQLSDFYDPTKAGMAALNVMQGQQHTAIQQQQADQQGKHLEMQNLQVALKAANPMESYPIVAKIMTMAGQPVPGVNEYYANTSLYNKVLTARPGTPEHTDAMGKWLATSKESRDVVSGENNTARARAGAGTLLANAGMTSDPNTAELMRQSGPMQSQVTDALAQSEMQKEKARALKDMSDENDKVQVNANARLKPLVTAAAAAGLEIDRSAPFVSRLDAIEQEYGKNITRLGKEGAAKARYERMAVNPDLLEFDQRRREEATKLKQSVNEIENQQSELQVRMESIIDGTETLKEGETLELLAGNVDSMHDLKAYKKAKLAVAENATMENHSALRNVKDQMDKDIASIRDRKKSSRESLNLRRAGLDEKVRMDTYKIEQESNEGKAQADWLEAGAKVSDLPTIARKYGVSPEKIRDAAKDPNRALTQVTIGQEKAESQTVGKGFGDEYLDSQKASKNAAGMLGKLDRMDTLLSGVTTGKLTPNMTEIQALGEAMGLKVDKSLGAKQAFTALSAEMALQLRNPAGGAGMPGAMSDKDREFLQSMTPSLAQTNDGNKLIIETARKVAQRDQHIAKMARTYRQKHGNMDEGFADQVQAYGEANPLFKGKSLPTSGQAPASSGTFNDAEKERRYQEYKRKNAK